jgi:hypothetical protein
MTNANKTLVRNPKGKRVYVRKILIFILKEFNLFGSEYGSGANSCEYSKELLSFVKRGQFLV